MDLKKGKETIINILFNCLDKVHYNLDRTKVMARCPYCGDSRSNKNTTSFNIRIPDNDDPRWLYICFRASCNEKGVITPEFMRMLDQNDYNANVYLNKVNRSSKRQKRFKAKDRRSIENFPSPDNKLSRAKLAYINKRLGINLELKDLIKLKINTDFESLYKFNDLSFPVKKSSYYKKLSTHGITFISAYNDYLIIRKVTNEEKLSRYTILDIFEGEDFAVDKFKFYLIPTEVDVMSVEPIVIDMGEGTFDILSAYFNLDIDSEYDNHIYVSVSGSTYEKTLVHLIRQYGLVDIIVNIFSDNDVSIDVYENLFKRVRKYTNTLTMKVYYNEMKKDFGFPESEIKIREVFIN